jgi:uncharacterized protein YciI
MDDEALKRLGGGRWQTRDERFTIEPGDGTWSLVDAVQTDELGLPLVRGPFRSLGAAKAAIAEARSGAAPASPLGARSAAITPVTRHRSPRSARRDRQRPDTGRPATTTSATAVDDTPDIAAPAHIPELPDGLRVEVLYVIEAPYAPDASARRPAVRRAHLERAAELMVDGKLVVAGGYTDMTTALLLVRAADEAEARSLVADDVYVKAGVWTGEFRVRPFARVVRDPD